MTCDIHMENVYVRIHFKLVACTVCAYEVAVCIIYTNRQYYMLCSETHPNTPHHRSPPGDEKQQSQRSGNAEAGVRPIGLHVEKPEAKDPVDATANGSQAMKPFHSTEKMCRPLYHTDRKLLAGKEHA